MTWRPSSGARLWVLLALVPFAVATIVGLVVLWPSGKAYPVRSSSRPTARARRSTRPVGSCSPTPTRAAERVTPQPPETGRQAVVPAPTPRSASSTVPMPAAPCRSPTTAATARCAWATTSGWPATGRSVVRAAHLPVRRLRPRRAARPVRRLLRGAAHRHRPVAGLAALVGVGFAYLVLVSSCSRAARRPVARRGRTRRGGGDPVRRPLRRARGVLPDVHGAAGNPVRARRRRSARHRRDERGAADRALNEENSELQAAGAADLDQG